MKNKEGKNEVGVFQMMKYMPNVPVNHFDEDDLEKLEERMVMIIKDFSKYLVISKVDDLEKIIRYLSMNDSFIYKDKYYEYQDRCYEFRSSILGTIRRYCVSMKQVCKNCKYEMVKPGVYGIGVAYGGGAGNSAPKIRYCNHREYKLSEGFDAANAKKSFVSDRVQKINRIGYCEQFESEKFGKLKSVRDLIISVLDAKTTDEIGAKHIKTTYEQIRNGKIVAMKQIFIDLGEKFALYADSLTNEELVKTHDFFDKHSEKADNEAGSEGLWTDYFEVVSSGAILSKKTLKKLRERKAFIQGG